MEQFALVLGRFNVLVEISQIVAVRHLPSSFLATICRRALNFQSESTNAYLLAYILLMDQFYLQLAQVFYRIQTEPNLSTKDPNLGLLLPIDKILP